MAAAVAAVVVTLPPAPAAALPPKAVRATDAVEMQPSAAAGFLAWSQRKHPDGDETKVKVRWPSGAVRRINPKGTSGFTVGGALAEDGSRIAYGQRRSLVGNIKLYNLRTGRRRNPPEAVNTRRQHEWGAAVSGRWLLFVRGRCCYRQKVLLANLRNGRVRRVDQGGTSTRVQTGDVTGRWATWTKCPSSRTCRNFRYDIETGRKVRLPNPEDRSQYASSVLGDGTVVYVENRNILKCDSRTRIFVQPRQRARRRLDTLREGVGVAVTSARRVGGRLVVTFDRMQCDLSPADIYRLRD